MNDLSEKSTVPMNHCEMTTSFKRPRLDFTLRLISALILAALLLIAGNAALAETIVGRVVGIADGDTVTVLDSEKSQHRVRLAGIDAPERRMPFGQRSKEHLSDLVFSKDVNVDTSKKDRYGRWVGVIFVDGVDANLAMVTAGMAWHYKQYEREQSASDRQLYANAENQARSRRAGLWLDPNPTPPWEYRKERRGGQ